MSEASYVELPVLGWLCGEPPEKYADNALGWTYRDEEAMAAFEQAHALGASGHQDLLLVLAPRHLSRVDEVDSLARSRGLRTHRYSAGKPTDGTPDVLLVDTLGDLAALYQLGQVAFVGGSLVPIGGHNLLEPVAVGVPLLFGPHTENVDQLAHILEQAGAARRVSDAAGLGRELCRLLDDAAARTEMSRRASEVLAANRGALERSVSLLLAVVDGR